MSNESRREALSKKYWLLMEQYQHDAAAKVLAEIRHIDEVTKQNKETKVEAQHG